MLFQTWSFAVFFTVVFVLYHRLRVREQNLLLLVASYVFYGWWDWRFLSLILLSTCVDFFVARRMPSAPAQVKRRLLLVSVGLNLSLLGFFKYFKFFAGSFATIMSSLGIPVSELTLQIVLPVGISFYTFQTMAYTIDVYRGRVEPVRDPVLFAVYVAFFPQLVAGPIERPQRLIPQLAAPRRVTGEQLASGVYLFLIGLVRKVAIADFVAPYVNAAFADPASQSSAALVLATVLFGVQIYGDFAGYSDMARGSARTLGIELMENFNHPYFSTNITVFWRRWHISLSTWLRDYLYIPLGGNRGPPWFVYRNLMLTMLLGGLWHGAAWTFVVWGGIHGVALAVHKLFLRGRDASDRAPLDSVGAVLRAWAGWLVTTVVVSAAWVFFRAPDFGTAFTVFQGMLRFSGTVPVVDVLVLPKVLVLLLLIDIPQYVTRKHTAVLEWPLLVRAPIYAAYIAALFLYYPGNDVPFIYFQF